MIKKSIIFKVFFAIATVQVLAMIVMSIIVYNSQSEIVNNLLKNREEFTLSKIKMANSYAQKKELEILNIMVNSVSSSLADAMYNMESDSAEMTIEKLLQRDNIKAIYTYDLSADSVFVVGYKLAQQIQYTDTIPESIKKLPFLKITLITDRQKIGYLKIYYDNSEIIHRLNLVEERDLSELEKEMLHANNKVKEELFYEVLSFFFGALFIIILIIILLKEFVNKPLIKFQIGLNSFFAYLENPKNKITKIDIDTEDEFGQMSKSVNESIQVSVKMHSEIANLMQTMDKNVITSETDSEGIITYVSQAFCEISGYTKGELIGSHHNILKHKDMDAETFESLWIDLKSGKSWAGEMKNMRRDGSFYWLQTIISPKCIKHRTDSCGYTAISYNITSKKMVEELTENLELKIQERTMDLVEAKKEVDAINKHTRDSIEYASLIQSALMPISGSLAPYFKDYFVTWTPKDTVGGDIWLFSELRHQDESLLMFIDCTGHGVPGAFVTMIVKAVEREVVSIINHNATMDVSPAWIMGYFNKTIKKLLRQETKDSLSNAGFDGGIIYYNRRKQILKFAGAETPLFYIDENGAFKTIKGDRYSVGYKKCDMNYEYKETVIDVKEGMKFYCTTDGYLDQNGGAKGFPFGKKRFSKIIQEHNEESMAKFQKILEVDMMKYENEIVDNDRNDDMTVIGFEIGDKSDIVESDLEEIVKYEGVMTQNVISATMDNIEAKIKDIGMMGNISTITIEYCQNMMNYSKNEEIASREIVPAGTIEVQCIDNSYYKIIAKNIISIDDKEKIEPKLQEIQSLDKSGIKKRYRELRKSGKNTHEKGGGIGLYEIAKVSTFIEYEFIAMNEDKYYFIMRSIVKPKVKVESVVFEE